VYANGGGFVTGNLDTDHAHCVELARATDLPHRLGRLSAGSGEPLPCRALADMQVAFDHAVQHARQLDADPSRIAVAGRDAGAALVAGLAQRVFDAEGGRQQLIRRQVKRHVCTLLVRRIELFTSHHATIYGNFLSPFGQPN
jgi:acetyl esterase